MVLITLQFTQFHIKNYIPLFLIPDGTESVSHTEDADEDQFRSRAGVAQVTAMVHGEPSS